MRQRFFYSMQWLVLLFLGTGCAVTGFGAIGHEYHAMSGAMYLPLGTTQRPDGVALKPFPTRLTPDLPYDVPLAQVRALESGYRGLADKNKILCAQRLFDILAWRSFLALNWPARRDGSPNRNLDLSDSYENQPRVWEHWINAVDIFRKNGERPKPWPSAATWQRNNQDKAPRVKAAWRHYVVTRYRSEQPSKVAESEQAFSGPLVDQNGKWVHYQVMVNKQEYDYIVRNTLYNLEGQIRFAQSGHDVNFPINEGKRHGAVEIKLAWKTIGPHDIRSRFFRITANVFNRDQGKFVKQEVGLVGMHIAMRTASSPQWIWATFEQVDNVSVPLHPVSINGKVIHLRPNFRNPGSKEPLNVLPPKNAYFIPTVANPVAIGDLPKYEALLQRLKVDKSQLEMTWLESKTKDPVQVMRVDALNAPDTPILTLYKLSGLEKDWPELAALVKNNPKLTLRQMYPEYQLDKQLQESAVQLNGQVQALLSEQHSVFQYYKLIGTQWPVHPEAPAHPAGTGSAPQSIVNKAGGFVVPIFNINSTMETYFQKGLQRAGPLEQDDRLPAGRISDDTPVFATESCVGCHYSAGIAVAWKTDYQGHYIRDVNHRRVPVFGINSNNGKTGNAQFSWMLEIEAQSTGKADGTGRY